MSEVKMYFDTEDELLECFEKWKPRLGLSDWLIACALVDKTDMDESLGENAGEATTQWVNKCGTISILKKEYIPEDLIIKQPHEATLIHEMLHFKFVEMEGKGREFAMFELMQHQLLEELAKALFMAEYNLDRTWFIPEERKA